MLTPRSISLRGVKFFELHIEYLCENEFLREISLVCLSEALMGWINKIKNAKKSYGNATLTKQHKKLNFETIYM